MSYELLDWININRFDWISLSANPNAIRTKEYFITN